MSPIALPRRSGVRPRTTEPHPYSQRNQNLPASVTEAAGKNKK